MTRGRVTTVHDGTTIAATCTLRAVACSAARAWRFYASTAVQTLIRIAKLNRCITIGSGVLTRTIASIAIAICYRVTGTSSTQSAVA